MRKEEVLWYENYNLDDIVTPVKPKVLQQFLSETGYDRKKTRYLVRGFTKGFSLQYRGPRKNIQRTAANLPITIGLETEMWNKIMQEVKMKRYAGPYKNPPYKDFIQSPLGLVPKDRESHKTDISFESSQGRKQYFS